MTGIIAAFLASLLFLGPLGWRVWLDKKRDEADAIEADIRAAVNHRLQGESLLSLRVTPRYFGRPGRIELSAPAGYEWLIDAAWPALSRGVPPGYDLVLQPGHSDAPRSTHAPDGHELSRAA